MSPASSREPVAAGGATPALAVALVCAAITTVVVLFAFSFGAHGYAPTDQGFILGQSWRIHGGQVPYRDFFYVRPPGSLYLHALWFALPEPWIFRAARIAYYAQLGIAALVPALFLLRAGLVASPARLAALCVAFYVIGLHNFPPMPWYTVDGVFFASLGLVALLASQRAAARRPRIAASVAFRVLASLLLGLASLAKQNYLALPALLVLLDACAVAQALGKRPGAGVLRARLLRLLASLLPAALAWGAVAVFLASADAWEPFLAQVGGASSPSALLDVGLKTWFTLPVAFALMSGFVFAWLGQADRAPFAQRAVLFAVPLLLGWLAWDIDGRTGHVLFAAILGASLFSSAPAFRSFGRGDPDPGTSLLVSLRLGTLALAWCASISFGAETPLLGLTAAGAAVETLLPRIERRASVLIGLVALLAVARVWELNAEVPYRSVPREQQTHALHEIFPRFGKLYGGADLAGRMEDLATQVETHALAPGRDFTVIPTFPLIHFLVDRQTRAPMDWYVVFDLFRLQGQVLTRLRAFDGVILLARDPSEEPCTGAEFSNGYRGLSAGVFRGSRLIASSRHFCVVEASR